MTSTMTTTMTEEAVRTITVRFIPEGRRSASAGFFVTGRNQESGEITVGVGFRNRHNGLIEVSFDLWRIDWNLSKETVNLIEERWLSRCERPVLRKLRWATLAFGPTYASFNVPIEQVEDWRGFLTELLSDPASYVDIRLRKARA